MSQDLVVNHIPSQEIQARRFEERCKCRNLVGTALCRGGFFRIDDLREASWGPPDRGDASQELGMEQMRL
jgi:hypothetical protein